MALQVLTNQPAVGVQMKWDVKWIPGTIFNENFNEKAKRLVSCVSRRFSVPQHGSGLFAWVFVPVRLPVCLTLSSFLCPHPSSTHALCAKCQIFRLKATMANFADSQSLGDKNGIQSIVPKVRSRSTPHVTGGGIFPSYLHCQ